jgi:methylated-DNA-[protein]-cysteine S-methyltransferase
MEMRTDPQALIVQFGDRSGPPEAPEARLIDKAKQQLDEYLSGKRKEFDLPVDWREMGSFQHRVLEVTANIPFGQVLTYADVARKIGQPAATRAVGAALGANPVAIIIPCHRVVGSDRSLHGFGAPGGVQTKEWLLTKEGHTFSNGRILFQQPQLF